MCRACSPMLMPYLCNHVMKLLCAVAIPARQLELVAAAAGWMRVTITYRGFWLSSCAHVLINLMRSSSLTGASAQPPQEDPGKRTSRGTSGCQYASPMPSPTAPSRGLERIPFSPRYQGSSSCLLGWLPSAAAPTVAFWPLDQGAGRARRKCARPPFPLHTDPLKKL